MKQIIPCASCGHEQFLFAPKCERCGVDFDSEKLERLKNEYRRIADRQRGFPVMLALIVAFQAKLYLGPGFNLQIAQIASITYLFLLIWMMAAVLSLATALKIHLIAALIVTLLCLVPFVGIVMTLLLNLSATSTLRSVGIRVGILGASKHDVEMALTHNCCRQCGYILTGLTSRRCPECGLAFTPSVAPSSPL